MKAGESQHPLHQIIGEALTLKLGEPDTLVLLDRACGGTEHVQLFCSEPLTCASRLCKVDAAIAHCGEVKVVIEIEESNIAPVQLGGKVFAPSLCRLCKGRSGFFPVGADLLFVQIIDVENLPGNSTKLDQCRKLLQIVPSSLSTTERKLPSNWRYSMTSPSTSGDVVTRSSSDRNQRQRVRWSAPRGARQACGAFRLCRNESRISTFRSRPLDHPSSKR